MLSRLRRTLPAVGFGLAFLVLAPAVAAADPAVQINGGATATNGASVVLTIAPPVDGSSMLRLSEDGGTTWAEVTYATSLAWSLIDPAAGGQDSDGTKTVTVERGDGLGSWTALGTATVLLDRTGPAITGYSDPPTSSGWTGYATPITSDGGGVGIASVEESLDGAHWAVDHYYNARYGTIYFDYRDGIIGGTWEPGPRTLWVRLTDKLGNVGPAFEYDTYATGGRSPDDVPATFAFPEPAVVGQTYTVQPTFDAGFKVPTGAFCGWSLVAGDWYARQAYYNPTLIRAETAVPAVNGVCPAWSFTLPYSSAFEYEWRLDIFDGKYEGSDLYYTSGTFRADPGTTTSRAFSFSSLPMYYILPDRDYVAADGTVTYRLYRAGGAPDRSSIGSWYCEPADVPSPPGGYSPQQQSGGTSFSCRVTTSEPWVAVWAAFSGAKRWLVEYDPVGDVRAPSVSTPVVLAGGLATSRTSPPVTVAWSGRDVGTGIAKYVVERSVDGGSWSAVTLTSARATRVSTRLAAGHSYRFRVRARDRAGNWSPWHTSAAVRATVVEESSSAVHFSSGWTRVAEAGASGGAVRVATASGQSATYTFTARSVGWVAARGPGRGFAQVRVDGVLVATVNLEAPGAMQSAVVWRKAWTTSGTHAVKITLLGTVGRPEVEVDAFELLH